MLGNVSVRQLRELQNWTEDTPPVPRESIGRTLFTDVGICTSDSALEVVRVTTPSMTVQVMSYSKHMLFWEYQCYKKCQGSIYLHQFSQYVFVLNTMNIMYKYKQYCSNLVWIYLPVGSCGLCMWTFILL